MHRSGANMTFFKKNNEPTNLTGPLSKDLRWSAGRKRVTVMQILHSESIGNFSRKLSDEIKRLARWHVATLAAIDSSMGSGPTRRSHRSRARPPQGLDQVSGL